MSTDNLPERLRWSVEQHTPNGWVVDYVLIGQAADALDEKDAEIERLRAAIAEFEMPDRFVTGDDCPFCDCRDSRYKYEQPHYDNCVWLESRRIMEGDSL